MNIFATSPTHLIAAGDLDDVRLRKMVLETAQLTCTALNIRFGLQTPYKPTHANHPCNKWSRHSAGNLQWLIQYGKYLHDEYVRRFGKTHKSGPIIDWCGDGLTNLIDGCDNTDEPMTAFANCARRKDLGLDFTHLPVHEAYRTYLNARWAIDKKRPKWTNTNPPTWASFEWHGDHIK